MSTDAEREAMQKAWLDYCGHHGSQMRLAPDERWLAGWDAARAALKPGDRGELLKRADEWLGDPDPDLVVVAGLIRRLAAALREPQPQAPSTWPFDQIKPIPNATPPSAAGTTKERKP